MSQDESIMLKLRNQVLLISVAACISLLGTNFLFMFTINNRVNDSNIKVEKLEDRFNTHLAQNFK